MKGVKGVAIDPAKLRDAITRNGWTLSRMSTVIGQYENYISKALSDERIDPERLDSICQIIKRQPKEFINEKDEAPEGGGVTTGTDKVVEYVAKINDTLFEVCNRQKVQQNQIAELIKMITELSKEQKRFFEATAKFYSGKKNFDVHGRWQ